MSKNDTEIGAKREPKWDPEIAKNREKRVSKSKVDHRRAPGPPQGRYWSHFGTHFGDFLVHVSVFPCVFNVFRVRFAVFPRVYDDLTLRFSVFFGNGDFTIFLKCFRHP